MLKWKFKKGIIDELSHQKGYDTRRKLVDAIVARIGWLDCARRGDAVRKDFAQNLADVLNVPLEEMGRPADEVIYDEDLYPLVGLLKDAAREDEDDVPFQDWLMADIELEEPNNPVAYLWASATGSKISARVFEEDGKGVLQVEFENDGESFPCNVAIHPTAMIARKIKPEQRYLVFEARSVKIEPGDATCPIVSIAVRIRDANLQQWEYCKADSRDHTVARVGVDPKTFAFDLKPDGGKQRWMKLLARTLDERPNFEVITTVIFVVGLGVLGKRPGMGKGVVEFGKLLLREQLEDGVTLL